MPKSVFIFLQYIFPHHLYTKLMGLLAESHWPWLKNFLIHLFIKKYHVELNDAVITDIHDFPTFNDFFIRKLKPETRPIATPQEAIISPVDGIIAQIGEVRNQQLLQAKNHYYALETLLGGDSHLAATFNQASFATIYLAPNNYHRVHLPLEGQLEKSIYIPGQLFSVNLLTADTIPNLYTRNERMVTIFNTPAGKMAVILVGAMIVGKIQLAWLPDCIRSKKMQTLLPEKNIQLKKGEELGYFLVGSTVILLFEEKKMTWNTTLSLQKTVKLGEEIARINADN